MDVEGEEKRKFVKTRCHFFFAFSKLSTMRSYFSLLAASLLALFVGASTARADLVVETATREVRRGEKESLKEREREREEEEEDFFLEIAMSFPQIECFPSTPLFPLARSRRSHALNLLNCNSHDFS